MKKVYLLHTVGKMLVFSNEELRNFYFEKIEKSREIIVKNEFNIIENEDDLYNELIKNKLNKDEIEYLKNNKLGDD